MSVTPSLRAARDLLLALREDYPRAVSEFAWPQLPERFCWAHDWFDGFARDNPAPGLVIVEEDGRRAAYSFAELVDASDRLAAWLGGRGIGRGDAVLVMLGNQVELWQVMLAVMKLGAVALPTTTAVGPAELTDRIERGRVRLVVCDPVDAGKLDDVPGDYEVVATDRLREAFETPAAPVPHPGTGPADPLLLYFTSGTTSRPKLVEHTQSSYPVGHLTTMYWLGLQPGDVHLNLSSPGWAKHAWSSLFAPWLAEATVVVHNYARFDPAALLRVLREERVTTFCAPPTVWRMLINADLGERPAALREVVGAGEPLNPEVIEQVRRAWGLTIRDGFGQTETTAQVGNPPGQPLKPGSMGRPLPGVPVVLVDPVSGEAGVVEGEICLDLTGCDGGRPVNLMTGYQGDPTRAAEVMAGGFYHTGDIAAVDADGYLTYVGRTDDVFKASDYKISPFELESVLIEHPAVAEAAVVPAPDEVRLAVPKAYIALAPGHEPTRETALSILAHARDQLAPYLRVRRIEFYDLPKTISGKIRRVELRAREHELAAAGIGTEFRDSDFPELRGAAEPAVSYAQGPSDPPLLEETIGANFERTVAQHGDHEALVEVASGRRWTYAELDRDVDALARGLMAAGVEQGDRVGVWAPNCAEWTITQFATAKIGAILVNVNPAYRTHEFSYVINQSGVKLLLAASSFKDSDYRGMVEATGEETPTLGRTVFVDTDDWARLIAEGGTVSIDELHEREAALKPDDPINIQYTSGTTGFPKGATLSHRNILNNGYLTTETINFTEQDRLAIPVPFYHCFGMVMGNLGCTTHGATMVIPAPGFDPGITLRTIQEERCTGVYGVPTMFIAMQSHPDFASYDLSSLRTGIMAGSPCPVEVMKRCVSDMGMTEVSIAYGMTETSPVSCQTRADDDLDRRTATIGRVHPHLEIKVVDPVTGETVERGRTGEFCTRGYSVMLGYWEEPEKTAEAIDADGWMHTGDLAVMREDGYCNIVGRIKDMVIRGGENIYPREIEEFLYTHPDIEDVQVIGVPDERYGEELAAWIKLRAGAEPLDADAVREFATGKLARYKIPRYVLIVEEFPMTVTGKIRKVQMREETAAKLGLTAAVTTA